MLQYSARTDLWVYPGVVMLIPMWQSTNNTPDSLVFTLHTGEVALLEATGFSRKRTRTTQSEMESPQFACLHRLIFEYDSGSSIALEPCTCCDYMYEIGSTNTKIYDEPVYLHGKPLGLSKCNNTMVWALPGSYYFHLNDTTGIGQAQVWIDVFKSEELPLGLLGDFTGVCHA